MNAKKSTSINVGGINNVSGGQINISGGNMSVQGVNADIDEIAKAFSTIKNTIDDMPVGIERNISVNALQGLEKEARKGDNADKNKVNKWLQFLAQVAPDAFDVAVDTFIHPIKGISTIFQKIAKQSKRKLQK